LPIIFIRRSSEQRRGRIRGRFWIRCRLAAVALVGLVLIGCIYGRIVYFNAPNLTAPSNFEGRPIKASTTPLMLQKREREAAFGATASKDATYPSLDDLLEASETRAFLVLHDDAIVYERYFGNVSEITLLPSFSISKTYAAVLIGCALKGGLISSLDDPLVMYVPDLAEKIGYERVTLEQLLRMTSGIDFDEESTAGAALYYCTDLRDRARSYDVKWPPGQHYLYGSVNIQLLWEALRGRLAGDTVSHYFEQEVWGPLGAGQSATWSLDSHSSGVEKFFGGFNATARDHALLGLLYLHGGTLNGRVILTKQWVDRSLSPDPVAGQVQIADGTMRRGRYQWFLTLDGRAYFAKGYHGQYIFVVPQKNAVFVRFGEGYGDVDWTSLFLRLAEQL